MCDDTCRLQTRVVSWKTGRAGLHRRPCRDDDSLTGLARPSANDRNDESVQNLDPSAPGRPKCSLSSETTVGGRGGHLLTSCLSFSREKIFQEKGLSWQPFYSKSLRWYWTENERGGMEDKV